MHRRALHLLALVAFWTASNGLALILHQHSEGQHHQTEKCSVCHDLLTSSKALSGDSPVVVPGSASSELLAIAAAQTPVTRAFNPAVSPRAPPFPA